ncbi:MAG: DUF2828 family protein [Clostridia bacterium]|nr:DUF2828 family protein [Clostridia bacterium]
MLEYLLEESNITWTENGAMAYKSTGSACLDLFASVGAIRNLPEDDIEKRFVRAFAENPDLAMKMLFYARDVRGGLGERRVFRVILRYLALHEPDSVALNLRSIPELGRWDDLLVLLDTPVRDAAVAILKSQLQEDLEAMEHGQPVSLLGKWLPSANASSPGTVKVARQLARALGLREAEYRRTLTALREQIRILENHLRTRDYTFDYAEQPARAMFRYHAAFYRNDGERYEKYLMQVCSGETRMHTGTVMPYEIVQCAWRPAPDERAALDATWRALDDFTDGENALVVADGSGSMYWGRHPIPAAVAQSLAIYFAERNRGVFHNHFITFSEHPRLIEIQGRDITEKANYCRTFNECGRTNIEAVFQLILKTAVRHALPQSELPTTLYIVSDMEFDACTEGARVTNFEHARREFERHGYRLPRVIFWNVQARGEQVPVQANAQGAALVSGCTPRIFSQVMRGEMDPYANMLHILGMPRYAQIHAA